MYRPAVLVRILMRIIALVSALHVETSRRLWKNLPFLENRTMFASINIGDCLIIRRGAAADALPPTALLAFESGIKPTVRRVCTFTTSADAVSDG